MRLSAWRAATPSREAMGPKVVTAIDTALAALGAGSDPECWVAWGDDPSVRYLVLVPIESGLIQLNVRVFIPGEGPRASGKLLRWSRVQIGELGVELHAGHRLLTFQIESLVLTGADATGDGIAVFARSVFAAADGRPIPVSSGGRAKPAMAGTVAKRSPRAAGQSSKGVASRSTPGATPQIPPKSEPSR